MAGDGWDSNSATAAAEAPSFAVLEGGQQAADAGGSKKTLLIAVVVIGLAAAGYFGWTKMQPAQSQPAVQQSAAPASSGTTALPPQPTSSVPDAQPVTGQAGVQQTEQGLSGATSIPTPSKPSAAVLAEVPGSKTPAQAKATEENDVTVVNNPGPAKAEPAPALVVQNGGSIQAKPQSDEPEQAPEASSIASGAGNSAVSGIVNTNAINAQKAPQQTLRISQGVSEGMVVKRVQPVYPAQARQMRLEGKVELQANISQSGSISDVKLLSGDPVLGRAAMDAVRQWKYKPYFLNGQPIDIQTQITVNFKLP